MRYNNHTSNTKEVGSLSEDKRGGSFYHCNLYMLILCMDFIKLLCHLSIHSLLTSIFEIRDWLCDIKQGLKRTNRLTSLFHFFLEEKKNHFLR